jgi:hypothetical protein
MSKILKRPMFRIGGSANDGIMSMAAPRKNYALGTEYKQKYEQTLPMVMEAIGPGRDDRLARLLIGGGLNLVAGTGAGGGTLSAVAKSFKQPTEEFFKAQDVEDALLRQIRGSVATNAISSVDAERLARLKIKSGYEAQTAEAQVKEYAASLKDYGIDAVKNRRGDIAEKVVQFKMNNPGKDFVGMPNIAEVQKQTPDGRTITVNGYNLATIPEGSIFFDPIEFQFKKRITKGIDPKTNKPILGEIYVDMQGREKTQQNLKNENVAPVQPEPIKKKGTISINPYRLG